MANQVCSQGRVTINGRVAKPGTEVKPGDRLEIQFGTGIRSYEVLDISPMPPRETPARCTVFSKAFVYMNLCVFLLIYANNIIDSVSMTR